MEQQHFDLSRTGIPGLDAVLGGGVPQGEIYLVQGHPGTGKTTVGLQFLLEGARIGERVLYITLAQTERTLRDIARSHGWSLEEVDVRELSAMPNGNESIQTVFQTAEVELGETVDQICKAVEELQPNRLVIDAIADMRVLAGNPVRYRKQLLNLRRFFYDLDCTVLFLDDVPDEGGDHELRSQAHGVFLLEQTSPEYGAVRRRLQVLKVRGLKFLTGYHNFQIQTGGLVVYPRIQANGGPHYDRPGQKSSGVEALDAMLGGGMEAGSSSLIVGPTGIGKTTLALLYAYTAARRGEGSAIFLFNERREAFVSRAEGLGMDIRGYIEEGLIQLRQINTGRVTPSEFAQNVCQAVEEGGARVVVIDSLTGYINSMLQKDLLVTQMHELLTYLNQKGVLTLLIVAQHGFLFGDSLGPGNVSYMADTVLLLRHYERAGELRMALSVLKKRYGDHARDVHEMRITDEGIEIGKPIREYTSVFLGAPFPQGNYNEALIANPGGDGHSDGEDRLP